MHILFLTILSRRAIPPVGTRQVAPVLNPARTHLGSGTRGCQEGPYTPREKIALTCEGKAPKALKLTRSEVARCKVATSMESLIYEAVVALAWQTSSSYRRWFSCWRGRGVQVNDLMNMTWVWRLRASH